MPARIGRWLVDLQEPAVLALDLVDGRYVTVAEVAGTGTAHLRRPFAVDVVPSALVAPPA